MCDSIRDAPLIALRMAVSSYAKTVRLLFAVQVNVESEYKHCLEGFPLGS
jgi:hypothetical protein